VLLGLDDFLCLLFLLFRAGAGVGSALGVVGGGVLDVGDGVGGTLGVVGAFDGILVRPKHVASHSAAAKGLNPAQHSSSGHDSQVAFSGSSGYPS